MPNPAAATAAAAQHQGVSMGHHQATWDIKRNQLLVRDSAATGVAA
jgi:hypothetical protein